MKLIIFLLPLVVCSQLVYEENFDELNMENWIHEISMSGGGNNEFQQYVNNRSISFVKDGVLNIKPYINYDYNWLSSGTINTWGHLGPDWLANDACTDNFNSGCVQTGTPEHILQPIQSAKLMSRFSFAYGRLETRMKLPKGQWLWPAFWLLPKYSSYGPWPASGEIDLMESRGNDPSNFASTLHYGVWPCDPWWLAHAEHNNVASLSDKFVVYGLEWNSTYIGTYIIDEKQQKIPVLSLKMTGSSYFDDLCDQACGKHFNPWSGRATSAPFDQKFYIIINLAVGGTNGYFDDTPAKPWKNSDPNAVTSFYKARDVWSKTWSADAALQVDWIRVYQ